MDARAMHNKHLKRELLTALAIVLGALVLEAILFSYLWRVNMIDTYDSELEWVTEYHDVKVLCFYNNYASGVGIVSVFHNGNDIMNIIDPTIIALWENEITEAYKDEQPWALPHCC